MGLNAFIDGFGDGIALSNSIQQLEAESDVGDDFKPEVVDMAEVARMQVLHSRVAAFNVDHKDDEAWGPLVAAWCQSCAPLEAEASTYAGAIGSSQTRGMRDAMMANAEELEAWRHGMPDGQPWIEGLPQAQLMNWKAVFNHAVGTIMAQSKVAGLRARIIKVVEDLALRVCYTKLLF